MHDRIQPIQAVHGEIEPVVQKRKPPQHSWPWPDHQAQGDGAAFTVRNGYAYR